MTAMDVRVPAVSRHWGRAVLRTLEFVAYPALAGAAFCLLSLGVVTWLPALAALAAALRRWRVAGESRCFVAVLREFPRCWRALWRHGVVSTVVIGVLVGNVSFLAGEPSLAAFALLAGQVGIGAAMVPYHLSLAAVSARAPDAGAAAWRRDAVLLAFGSPVRGICLLAAAVAAPALTLIVPFGPLLLGPSLAVLAALVVADRYPTGTESP
jgi:uncharacterized membrane protein YesL